MFPAFKQFLGNRASDEPLHRRWIWMPWMIKVLLVVIVLGMGLRASAYLVPIRPADLHQVDQAIEFQDRHGLPLGTLFSVDPDHTAVVSLEQVSPHFRQAILAAEDRRFYHHGVVDWRAVVRASLQALENRRIVSGASTITMQLARLVEPVSHTPMGKLQQVWYGWRIAAGMDREAILAAYINRLPMGGNLYGVEAAAHAYFGTPAADLTVAQASLLAALPNAPSALNPYTHWADLKQRQAYVLRRMVEDGYLTQPQADRAYAQTVTLRPPTQGLLAAPHFLFWVADHLPTDAPAQIRTTLDLELQRFVEAQVRQVVRGLAARQVRHAAAMVIDNATGEVLAYVGSPSYFAPEQAGRNDGVQALRQPGSTLKPFLYQLALERGDLQPNTILADVPTHYPIPGAQLYSPTDFSDTFQGPVRVRVALGNSLNIPAVRVLEKVGVPAFLERLHQLGFQHLQQTPDYYGLGLALGSGEVSLWELARAYLILAHQGDRQTSLVTIKGPPSSISQFPHASPSPSGAAEFTSKPQAAPTWSLITDILADVHARAAAFGVESVLNLPFPAAVKTGTSSDFRDTWTVGFTTDYTVATWVGNFDGSPMRQVSGVTGAAPLWHRIMVHLHESQEPEQFSPPTGMVKRPICALTGQKPTADCAAVVEEYFFPDELVAYESSGLPTGETEGASHSQGSTTQLKIISPRAGSRFLLYPSPEGDSVTTDQRLEFEIINPQANQVEWQLNGQQLETQDRTSLFWPMQPGHWTLEVRNGQQQAEVSFEVLLAEDQPARRGFSVVKSP